MVSEEPVNRELPESLAWFDDDDDVGRVDEAREARVRITSCGAGVRQRATVGLVLGPTLTEKA